MRTVTYSIFLTGLKIQQTNLYDKVFVICVHFLKPVQKEEIPHSKFKENQGSGNSKGKYFKKLRFHFSSIMTTYVLLPLLTRKNLS